MTDVQDLAVGQVEAFGLRGVEEVVDGDGDDNGCDGEAEEVDVDLCTADAV